MSAPIYLSRIRLSNFRTYGDNFEMEIPAAPGLTVVCGMNGLGKTAFFDAIEWGLLGEIQRLSPERLGKPEGSPLTREGAPARSHRVELSWGSDHHLIRTEREAPSATDLATFLKSPDWRPQIHDLGVYLRLTHFLPQATRERFLERDKKTQWTLLQGPAGVERLERFRKMLDDGKARNAFERRAQAVEEQIRESTKRLDEWKQLLADYERWSAVATAVTAISPADLESVLAELETKVGLAKGTRAPASRITALRTAVEAGRSALRNLLQDLAPWETSTRRYLEITQRLRMLGTSLPDLEKDLESHKKIEAETKARAATLRDTVRQTEDRKRQTDQQALAVLTALETESRRIMAAKSRPEIEQRIAELAKQVEELAGRRKAYREQQAAYDHATKGAELARQNLSAVEQLQQQGEAFSRRHQEWQDQAGEAKSRQNRRAAAETRRETAERKTAELNQELKTIGTNLSAEQRNIDETNRALSEVVQRMAPDETTCPVCAQVHPPGELLRKAQASIERHSQRSAVLIGELHKAQVALVETSKVHAVANAEWAEIDRWLAARAKERAELDQMQGRLLAHPLLAGSDLAALPNVLRERREVLQKQLAEYGAKAAAAKPNDQATLAAQQFDAVEKGLQADLQKAAAELQAATGLLQECEAKLATASELIATGGGLAALPQHREGLLRIAAKLEEEIRDAKGRLAEEEKHATVIAQTMAERAAKHVAENRLAKELRAEADTLLGTWRKLGLSEEPNESEVQEARRKTERQDGDQQRLLEKISSIADGLESWAKRDQVAGLERTIAKWQSDLGANTLADCTRMLQQKLQAQAGVLQRIRIAQARAEKVAALLMELSGQFSESALLPLSTRISAFNRLISPFPYEFRINSHVTATRTRTENRVAVPGMGNNRMIERDPEWWLSEGQMSAMGLSVLLGASTVYRWSRWRALLLDDPLQNTDLIHAAAFGDVIRSLMRDEGFQVIVSTHDYDEAEFLIRKCRRANLPVRKLDLLGLGPTGLRYSIKES